MKPILLKGFQFAASFFSDFGHPQRDGTGWKSHPSLRDSSSLRGCEIVYAFSESSIFHPFWDIPSGMDFNLRMKWWFYFPSRFFKYIRHPAGWANGMENRRCLSFQGLTFKMKSKMIIVEIDYRAQLTWRKETSRFPCKKLLS